MADNFKEYVVHYRFQGADWGTTIKATSVDDARRRIEAMGAFGRIDGELMATIPDIAASGLVVRALVWLRNFWRRTDHG